MSKLRPPPQSLLDKYRGGDFRPLYTTSVTVRGGEAAHGRASGIAISDDGELLVELRLPVELGGTGGGTNPEQLFAAGWSACFLGAMGLAANKRSMKLPADTAVDAEVDLGTAGSDYFLQARLKISVPNVERELAEALVQEAHQTCPYSKMSRGNIDVELTVV